MASFEGVGSGTTGAQYYTLKLEVYEESFSIPYNNSKVSWALYLTSRNNYSFSSWSFPVVVNVDGEVYNSSEYRSMSANSTLLIASGSKTVNHSNNGSKIISCSATVKATGAYYLPGNISVSGTLKLTDIPRASTVSCNSFNIGDATTIVISRASNSFTHTVTWALKNASGTIATKTSTTTIGATIPTSSLYAQIPNSKSGVGTITCQTYSGDTLIGTSTCNFTAYAKESECIPTVSASIVDTNDTTIALTGSNTNFIKGFSNAKVTISAIAKNSASISSYYTNTGDGRTSNTTVTQFNNINSKYISVKATDSRGYPKSVDYTLTWIEYIRLAFTSITVKRPESTADKANLELKGNYFNNSFGSVNNSLALKYRYKEENGEYTEWSTVIPTITDNAFTHTEQLENLDHNKEYTFEFMIDDQLMTVYSDPVVLTKGIPVLRVGKNYIKVNGNRAITDNKYYEGSCNDITDTCVVYVQNGTDCPEELNGVNYGFLFTKYITDNYMTQTFEDVNSNRSWKRIKIGGTWSSWKKQVLIDDIIGDIESISCAGTAAVTTTAEVELGLGTIEKAGKYLIVAFIPINYYGQTGRQLTLRLRINGKEAWCGGGVINSSAYTLYTQLTKIVNIPENANIKVTAHDETGKTFSCLSFSLEYIRLK